MDRGDVIDSSALLHPDILESSQLRTVLNQRGFPVPPETDRRGLLDLFYQNVLPLPRRQNPRRTVLLSGAAGHKRQNEDSSLSAPPTKKRSDKPVTSSQGLVNDPTHPSAASDNQRQCIDFSRKKIKLSSSSSAPSSSLQRGPQADYLSPKRVK